MKIETAIIITKGVCFTVIGGMAPLATGLGQWMDSGHWPPLVNWVVIGAGCFVGAATQMLAFLSQSFSDYKIEMKTSGEGSTLRSETVTVQTKNEPATVPAAPPAETKPGQ